MKRILPVIVFVLAQAAAAMAQNAAPPLTLPPESNTVTGVAPNAGDKLVCVQGDAPTGSRLGSRKTCRTAAQWQQIHDSSMQLMDNMQMRGETAEEGKYGR